MPEPLTIRIDMTPHRILSPNNSRHPNHGFRTRHKNELREQSGWATMATLNGTTWRCSGPIIIHLTFAWEARRKRLDTDNAIAIAKAAIDGVFDCLDANDRQVIGYTVEQTRDKAKQGYMTMTIEPYAAREEAA